MTELRKLYQQIILDHNKQPRNYGRLENANRDQEGHNPLCGDRLHLYLHVDGERMLDIRFEGSGCAISRASASLMTVALKGGTLVDADAFIAAFLAMIMSAADAPVDTDRLGKLAIFAGVREFPMRIKCATLPWHTVRAALKGTDTTVTTE